MTRKQMLSTWGCLRTLADIYQQKHNALIRRGDDLALQIALNYDRQIAEINSLMQTIEEDIASMPDERGS